MIRWILSWVITTCVYACIWYGLATGPALALTAMVFYLENQLSRLGITVGQALGKLEEQSDVAAAVGDASAYAFGIVVIVVGAVLGTWLQRFVVLA
ncbi:MAG: hypothetical protein MI725_01985 [Pirellulales bacterium]|nr:hypothetical protein [Pirellulales bacterium]